MEWRTKLRLLAAAAGLLASTGPAAQALYATSVRTFAAGGQDKVVGSIYTVNLADASAKLVAPIRLDGETAVGITGLAVHPVSGVFFGITSSLSPVNPRSLVTLDVNTGDAQLVGALGAAGSDIAFDARGTLYVWLPATSQLGVVDLGSATVTRLGVPGPPGSSGGIAIDDKGIAYVTPGGAGGTLDQIDTHTGALRRGPPLRGAPFPGGITAMTFTPSGLLLALNSNVGSPANVRLVAINTSTGQMSSIGALPDDADSLAFASTASHDIRSSLATISGRTLALLSLILGLIIAVAAMVLVKSLRG
jgi:hypothetical protein